MLRQSGRIKCGHVEAYTVSWIEILASQEITLASIVEAYTVSWIEIVDGMCAAFADRVEAYTVSWIEIS